MQKYQTAALKSLFQKIYVFAFLALSIWSCSPTKNLKEGEIYLQSNQIKIHPRIIEQDRLYPYIKQRDNKRALWVFKIKMQQYLIFNDSNLAVKNEKKREKIRLKNQRRLAAGKDTINFKPVLFSRIKESGEPPVIFDSSLVESTIYQFEKALFNQGYFNNDVYVEYAYNDDSTKIKVQYKTHEGDQYHIHKVSLVIADTGIKEAIKVANKSSHLHKGNAYSTDDIDAERSRFASEMRNQGYFFFSKEYLEFEIDSTIGDHQVDIKFMINNPESPNTGQDSTIETKHKKYKIGQISLNTSYNPKLSNDPTDSIHFENLIFTNLSRFQFNPHTFTNKLFYSTGDFYSEKLEARTYTRLSGMNNFKYINIGFTLPEGDSNILNCNILMTPFPSQSIGIEIEGTNTSGNLGVSGYLNYTHRNIFKHAEHLKIRVKGGVEAQQTNSANDNSSNNAIDIFNTYEFGIETSIIFQDLLLPHRLREKILRKFNRPKTSLNYIINIQNRPDFKRFLSNASMGYLFTNKKVNTNEFFIYPFDVSFIRIEKDSAFAERLAALNNPLLDATYDNQFIMGIRVLENWTNRSSSKQTNFILNRASFESAGSALQLANNLLNSDRVTDDFGDSYYTIGGVRYAQFLKLQNDLHYNTKLSRNTSMAYRFLGGVGVPFGNANALPYDRSFYGGGANDNRGWRARSLGPGSMIDSLKAGVDQVADIKLQISAEYRFTIFKSIEGAIFADAGNIWLIGADTARPNADFQINRFYKEIALSAGAGIRFNFGSLLVRLDWGVKLIDPNLPEGQRFVLKPEDYLKNYQKYSEGKSYQYSVVNLGIGYPF